MIRGKPHNIVSGTLKSKQRSGTRINPKQPPRSRDGLRSQLRDHEVLAERYLIPQIAIGARDVLGRCLGGEYLVASKQCNSFDVSLGIGWGRLGTRSDFPIRWSSVGAFESRPKALVEDLERVRRKFFSRDIFFGGIAYQIPEHR